MQLVQTVVPRGLKLRRVLADARRGPLHFLKGRARRRHLRFEAKANFTQRLSGLCCRVVHRMNQVGKPLAHSGLFTSLHFLRSLRQLLHQPLQAAVERRLQQFAPFRLSEIHLRSQTAAPGVEFVLYRSTGRFRKLFLPLLERFVARRLPLMLHFIRVLPDSLLRACGRALHSFFRVTVEFRAQLPQKRTVRRGNEISTRV